MITEVVLLFAALIAAVRTTGYGIYTWTDKNRIGAVGLFVVAALCAAICVMTAYFILTNV
ncbi:MAG: hypothetical protein Q4G33_11895 [bacterium]|nr:hypothetical protein [bacterium]